MLMILRRTLKRHPSCDVPILSHTSSSSFSTSSSSSSFSSLNWHDRRRFKFLLILVIVTSSSSFVASTRTGSSDLIGLGRTKEPIDRETSRDELRFHRKHPEVFYDTHLIPDGLEVPVYLTKGKFNRFFFLVDQNSSQLTLRVSACADRVSWKFYFLFEPPEDYDFDPPDNNDDIGQPSSESNLNLPAPILLKSCRHCPPISGYSTLDPVFPSIGTPSPWAASFVASPPLPGVYSLVVSSPGNTHLRLYATTLSEIGRDVGGGKARGGGGAGNRGGGTRVRESRPGGLRVIVPPGLPSNRRIQLVGANYSAGNERGILLSWKKIPGARSSVYYCLSVNTRGHLATLCAAQRLAEGGTAGRPTPPPYSGFDFPRHPGGRRDRPASTSATVRRIPESTYVERGSNISTGRNSSGPTTRRRSQANHEVTQNSDDDRLKYHDVTQRNGDVTVSTSDYKLSCVSGSTFKFKYQDDLAAGKTYYFDLFAVDAIRRTSVAYVGTAFNVPRTPAASGTA